MRAARIAETEGVMPPPADMAETQLINVIHKTSFLDLSAELRNGIYMLLLTQPWPMTIGSIDDWKGSSRALNKPAIQCRNLQDHCLREHEIPHHNTAMLQVNRQIHSEATSVLYGHNRIQWLTRDISKTFLNRIGPSIIHLRDVKLPHNTTKSTMRTVLNALKPAGRLVRLEISVHTWHNMDAHRMAKVWVLKSCCE